MVENRITIKIISRTKYTKASKLAEILKDTLGVIEWAPTIKLKHEIKTKGK